MSWICMALMSGCTVFGQWWRTRGVGEGWVWQAYESGALDQVEAELGHDVVLGA